MENTDINKEITRIKKEFIRRRKEIPSDFYSIQHPANLYMYLQRTYEVINLLKMFFFSISFIQYTQSNFYIF